jgi:hypothetical protein
MQCLLLFLGQGITYDLFFYYKLPKLKANNSSLGFGLFYRNQSSKQAKLYKLFNFFVNLQQNLETTVMFFETIDKSVFCVKSKFEQF